MYDSCTDIKIALYPPTIWSQDLSPAVPPAFARDLMAASLAPIDGGAPEGQAP